MEFHIQALAEISGTFFHKQVSFFKPYMRNLYFKEVLKDNTCTTIFWLFIETISALPTQISTYKGLLQAPD